MLVYLRACPSLTELTVIGCQQKHWPMETVSIAVLPQLRYLQLHTHRLFSPMQPDQLTPLCSPSLSHLALVLAAGQPTWLLDLIDTQRLPHLTHCHVSCITPASQHTEWTAARERLKARLGSVCCDKEKDVARWRADRVWRRSVGLSDHADDYRQIA